MEPSGKAMNSLSPFPLAVARFGVPGSIAGASRTGDCAGDMEKVLFVNVVAAAQQGLPHAAAIKDLSEAPFRSTHFQFLTAAI